MNEQSITTIMIPVLGFLTTAFAGMMTYFMARLKYQAEAAASAAKKVAEDLEETNKLAGSKLDTIAKTSDATHKLVNSQMTIQLRLSAVAFRRVAELTNDPKDETIAEEAEKKLADHEAQQKADSKL